MLKLFEGDSVTAEEASRFSRVQEKDSTKNEYRRFDDWNDYYHVSRPDFPSIYDFDFPAELVIYKDNLRLTSDEETNRMNKYEKPNNKLSQ